MSFQRKEVQGLVPNVVFLRTANAYQAHETRENDQIRFPLERRAILNLLWTTVFLYKGYSVRHESKQAAISSCYSIPSLSVSFEFKVGKQSVFIISDLPNLVIRKYSVDKWENFCNTINWNEGRSEFLTIFLPRSSEA